jgi:pyruvate-formate lyase-activating enzyme
VASKKKYRTKTTLLTALVANRAGEIFELDGYAAVGMANSALDPLSKQQTCSMPHGSELMYLSDRIPILLNIHSGRFETLRENPYLPGEPIFPVAAFNSPGYVITKVSAYRETASAQTLPLFSYGAVGWHKDSFRSAVILVDPEPRQDLQHMPRNKVVAGVNQMRKRLPNNRLRAHLEKCALTYGCPAGKNFFLGRYEAPLPTAQQCNARCLGCLSFQNDAEIAHSQDRIAFTPSPKEIAELALVHIRRVNRGIVSFGQGCEGDPLLAVDVIEPAIDRIRAQTAEGTINMNTNGSLPANLKRLVDAGLDSVRISMNSVRDQCYDAYFRPKGYRFADVLETIDTALARNKFVAINYLNCPGFSDTAGEIDALVRFLKNHPVHMIQWRNLNFDPLRYWNRMKKVTEPGGPIGMEELIDRIGSQFPKIRFGYFNPPKENFWGYYEIEK